MNRMHYKVALKAKQVRFAGTSLVLVDLTITAGRSASASNLNLFKTTLRTLYSRKTEHSLKCTFNSQFLEFSGELSRDFPVAADKFRWSL